MGTNSLQFSASMIDLGMAYRKAKADLFYSPRACRKDLSDFESNLWKNLEKLQQVLKKGDAPSILYPAWTVIPKEIKVISKEGKDDEPNPPSDIISSDPQHLWEEIHKHAEGKSRRVNAEFRLMENLPIAFHIFSALWINKVGHKFEEKLADSAKGNRLRRGKKKDINILSLGSVVPYIHPYREWRDDAFVAIETALQQDKSVVAITADISSFYHKLDVRFMLDESFIKQIGVQLEPDEKSLHTLFINALNQWAQSTPLKQGLPVGLTASSVIANVALLELDRLFEREVVPLYYGRYVDDIILVMENGAEFKKSVEVWEWLIKRMPDALSWKEKDKKLLYKQPYLENSEIIFANEKNKTFLLAGQSGHSILQSIKRQVQIRTSEWRSLPDLPSDATELESKLLTAIQQDGLSADSLRKADKVSVRRAEFAMKLRDIEAYARALPPDSWQAQRHAFLNALIHHILILPTCFDFFNYLPRILTIAVSCGDFAHLRQVLDNLEQMLTQLEECKECDISIKAQVDHIQKTEVLKHFRENIKVIVRESIECAFPLTASRELKDFWIKHFSEAHNLIPPIKTIQTQDEQWKNFQEQHKQYMKQDLAYRPLKIMLLPPALSGLVRFSIPLKKLGNLDVAIASKVLDDEVLVGCKIVKRLAKIPVIEKAPSGLLFPTRPLGIQDLYILHPNPFSERGSSEIAKCLLGLRGFSPESYLPVFKGNRPDCVIKIPYGKQSRNPIHIAVSSWKTDVNSWTAAVSHHPDPDVSRLERLNHLLNNILRCRKRPDYLILPELSIPARWFLSIAGKLQGKGISLICGIEYLHSRKIVHNQVWAALSHDALGFPATMIYRQDKQRPALHEEQGLRQVGGEILRPQLPRWKSPPIINHGGFQFALLICSELTNISYRSDLRGKVDALFVPEWNQDTESFNALVESAALDIHSYIIQCNDRQYGDSRIRSPHKDNWMRDIVRVKGGREDYFVIGEIDIEALRAFQSHYRSPSKPFKPVPDGFEIASERRILPSETRVTD